MEGITLIVPKQVIFTSLGSIQTFTIQNPSSQKLAIKVRTNHKTALHIQPTHDFVQPNSKKDFIIKLVQLHHGVKLQINYCKATEEMINKKDSKMTNVDKKDIKKQITVINVDQVKNIHSNTNQIKIQKTQSNLSLSQSLNASFVTVAPQKSQIKPQTPKITQQKQRTSQRKDSISISAQKIKQSEHLIVVEQRHQQDQQQQLEEKTKKLKQQLEQIQTKLYEKRRSIMNKMQKISETSHQNSFIPLITLPFLIIIAFLLGSLLKWVLY